MRTLSIPMLLAACHGATPPTAARPSSAVLRARPHMRVAIDGCNGSKSGTDVELPNIGPAQDVPIVTLEELHMHGAQPPVPTIAVWQDGEVLFAHERDGVEQLLVTRTSRANAAAIADRVFGMLDSVPRYTNVFDASGGVLTRITVRVGDRWRSVAVYGDRREDFLGVAHGTAAPPKPKPAEPSDSDVSFSGPDFSELLAERPWPPLGFAKAYQQLVENGFETGKPFEPYEYDVLFITPERGIDPALPALSWPDDLPKPPADLDPAACHYNESEDLDPEGGCHFMLAPLDNRAAERFEKAVRKNGHSRGVTVNGTVFAIRFDETYRGERTIDAITTCAGVLAHRNHNAPH